MHDASLTRSAIDARSGLRTSLALALAASRADTLATFAAYIVGLVLVAWGVFRRKDILS